LGAKKRKKNKNARPAEKERGEKLEASIQRKTKSQQLGGERNKSKWGGVFLLPKKNLEKKGGRGRESDPGGEGRNKAGRGITTESSFMGMAGTRADGMSSDDGTNGREVAWKGAVVSWEGHCQTLEALIKGGRNKQIEYLARARGGKKSG